MEILNQGFDHVEYSVTTLAPMTSVLTRMGFEKMGERDSEKHGTQTVAYAQGLLRILLTAPKQPSQLALPGPLCEPLEFLKKQAEGICVLGVEVKDATAAFKETVGRGAKVALEPTVTETPQGRVVRAEIYTPGNVRYAFMERHAPKQASAAQSGVLFDEGLVVSRLESPSPLHIRQIDHLTNNVAMGEMKKWVSYYQDIFGFKVTRHFDIRTLKTGLISDVVESPDRRIKVPINEPTEEASQIQEFVNRMKGPGVQHLALLTTDIQSTLRALRKQAFEFLTVPHTYYEVVPTRIPEVTEDLAVLEDLGILLDGEGGGYLLQIFSQEILGPFFFEYIQRKGNEGFGEGNFRALFEAIERDQIRRGVVQA